MESISRNKEIKPFDGVSVRMPQKDLKTITGIALIAASYIFCWPLIGLLGLISAYLDRPLIFSAGGTFVYFFSYVLLFAGIYLAGKKYVKEVYVRLKTLALKFVAVN